MPEDTTEFSLHEMENIKRKMSHIETSRESSFSQMPTASAPGSEDVMVHDHMPHHGSSGTHGLPHHAQNVSEGESLHFRRSLRVLHRHILIIFFIIIVIPSVIWVADTFYRPKIYVAQTFIEQLDEAQSRDIMIGVMRLSAGSGINDINRILQDKKFERELRARIYNEAQLVKREMGESTDIKVRQEKEKLYRDLENMAGNLDKDTPQEFYSYRGSVSATYTDEEIISLSVRGRYPEIHTVIANNIVHAANKIAGEERVKQIADFREQLAEARDEQDKRLESIRNEINRITGLISEKDVKLGSRFSIVNQLQMEEHKAQIALSKLELRLKHLKQEMDWEKAKIKFNLGIEKDLKKVLVKGNPLREKWRLLLAQKEEMSAKYTEEHPKYQRVQRDIDAVLKQLKVSGNVTSRGSVPALPSLQEELLFSRLIELNFQTPLAKLNLEAAQKKLKEEKQAEEMDALSGIVDPKERQRMRMLQDKRSGLVQQRETHKAASLELYRRIGEIDMLLAQVQKELKFKQPKPASASLVSPKVALDVALGLMLGVVLGCSVAFLLESVDNKLHTPFDVYYHLKLNYLGVVPFWGEKETVTISPDNPDSHISEIYAHLRNNIRYGRSGSPEKCLLIASATQSEGKSTVSANLATSYALEGNNVILIDADLRRPRGHKLLETFHQERPIQYGLADYLTGDVDFDEIIYSTSVPGLSLIPAGSRVRNPAKLMGSMEMQDMIDRAEDSFDIVIIDCPAVLPVVDATTLSGRVRGVLMVIAAEEVEIAAVRMALYRLQHVGSPIVGAVLNKVRERSTSYYYYGYRYRSGYYYSPYSEPYADSEDEDNTA
ncbi:MAG: polysaccharide biosynthesis tyrosine autokinase [Planctomycetota bacterium]|jgi:capsular exopolysaccharide synthesis family protein